MHEEDEAPFEESCLAALREMIRVNRNHPSILVWSMGNEIFFTRPETADKARRLVRKLVAASHEADPTRPAASGLTVACAVAYSVSSNPARTTW